MNAHTQRLIADLLECDDGPITLVFTQPVDHAYVVRIRNLRDPLVPLFDRRGDKELVGSGATLNDALAALDLVCSTKEEIED